MKSKLCNSCIHTNVCFKDKNLFGDIFVMGNPIIFDNRELYEKYKERERKGFPCDDFIEKIEKTITVVHCDFIDCIYNIDDKCNKREIYLDNRVDDIFVGCPDAEWENNGDKEE